MIRVLTAAVIVAAAIAVYMALHPHNWPTGCEDCHV